MKLSNFDYCLPKELIAQYPLKERDSSRLMVIDKKTGAIEHRIFKDILGYFKAGDLLVLNDSKVLPCRLKARRISGGKIEILLIQRKSGLTFKALIKPGRIKIGEKINFNSGSINGIVTAKDEITFSAKDINAIYGLGVMPLPPYIKREPEDIDNLYYQTVYARENGSIASPTAGLHFTERLIKEIESCGVNFAYITLHVGLGTFKPVKADEITSHKMDPESFKVPQVTVDLIERAHQEKARIFAVGTTSLRALESYALGVKEGCTDLFIYPGYKFKLVDCLLTNFHLPKTTLFMLVCGLLGERLAKRAYGEAINKEYRFYSYGDAMLIL